jgi:hypothetical protein
MAEILLILHVTVRRPCLIKCQIMNTYNRMEVQLRAFLSWALYWDECSAPRSGRFAPGTNWIGGCVAARHISRHCGENRTPICWQSACSIVTILPELSRLPARHFTTTPETIIFLSLAEEEADNRRTQCYLRHASLISFHRCAQQSNEPTTSVFAFILIKHSGYYKYHLL